MNRHLVSVSWKRSTEAVLLIVTMKFFNNSNYQSLKELL
ncbi:hypothetical protein LEP1GSC021_3885 [Leptospira noguchii str. 1993005606]|nr:hypothetical protein LEP1GSC021_3885 [Leptospira noguchii str. 1993005606]